MKKLLALLIGILMLAGCDLEYNVDLKVSEIRNMTEEVQVKEANIRAEVIECKDDDTGLISKYVLEAKQHVPYMFNDAKYTGCVDVGMDDFACFDTKFYMFRASKETKYQLGKFTLKDKLSVVRSHTSDKRIDVLLINLSHGMKERIRNVKKSSFRTPTVKFQFTLTNDTKELFGTHSWGVYINDNPVQSDWKVLQPGEKIRIRLSQVTVECLLKYEYAIIFEIVNDGVTIPPHLIK